MENFGLYIHIPFCERKCYYCDFCSFVASDDTKRAYIDRVIDESKRYSESGVFDTVFIGGGTPTAMPDGELLRMVKGISKQLKIAPKEFTIEGNPNTFSDNKIAEFLECGMTRASVGVQSFNDNELKAIGRLHTPGVAVDAVKRLVASGVDVSCDLMVGLPGQTPESVESSVSQAIELGVGHISCYSLILEDNTPMNKMVLNGELTLPSEDDTVDMYDKAVELLAKAGLNRYEISNFGKPCLHNMRYWTRKQYLGLGLSAHSLIGNIRQYNTDDYDMYMSGSSPIIEEVLSPIDIAIELIILGLRTSEGVRMSELAKTVDKPIFDKIAAIFDKFRDYYYMGEWVSIRPQYLYCENNLLEHFMDLKD